MKIVFKYQLDFVKTVQVLEIPVRGVVLRFESKHGKIDMYTEVDTDQKSSKRKYVVYETAAVIGERFIYIGTVTTPDFVGHIYQELD